MNTVVAKIATIAQAKRRANEELNVQFLRWAVRSMGATWTQNPWNDSKFELIDREGTVLVQVMGYGEVIQSGTLSVLYREFVRSHPYYAVTRDYKANGDCVKGMRRFRSEDARCRFIRTTNAAVTFHN